MFRPMPTSDLLSGHRRGELLGERDARAASAAAFLRSLKAATSSLGSRSNLPKPCCETIVTHRPDPPRGRRGCAQGLSRLSEPALASTAAVRLKVFSNVVSRVTCSRIAGSRGSPARKRTWPSRSIVAFTAAFSRAACASQELRTPVVGRVNSLTSISGEKSEEDHATNLIYIEIFKIGVDPLSEAAVVKTKASSAGTREPSARRIDVD